ncbi:hypothetical protein [Spirochaeta cellobiosiphila]|uniref:hypothetical protein n=1 Tax=Spirochaeta cellobiosiphila TaxID=504483 RepID=UPI00048B3707|nr:hypothetical protein [Spirochaeta cellobiosiphila]
MVKRFSLMLVIVSLVFISCNMNSGSSDSESDKEAVISKTNEALSTIDKLVDSIKNSSDGENVNYKGTIEQLDKQADEILSMDNDNYTGNTIKSVTLVAQLYSNENVKSWIDEFSVTSDLDLEDYSASEMSSGVSRAIISPANDQEEIEDSILPAVNKALNHLNIACDNINENTITVSSFQIDKGDLLAYSGVLKIAKAIIQASLVLDFNAVNPNDKSKALKYEDLENFEKINIYLANYNDDTSNFLGFYNANYLLKTRLTLLESIKDLKEAVKYINNETDDQVDDLITPEILSSLNALLDENKNALSIHDIGDIGSIDKLLNVCTGLVDGSTTVRIGGDMKLKPGKVFDLKSTLSNGLRDFKLAWDSGKESFVAPSNSFDYTFGGIVQSGFLSSDQYVSAFTELIIPSTNDSQTE